MCVDPKGLTCMTAYQASWISEREECVIDLLCAFFWEEASNSRPLCGIWMPLRGDPSYHPQKSKAPFCLHAIEMRYQDLEGKQIITHAPLPETFKAALKEANIKATPISNFSEIYPFQIIFPISSVIFEQNLFPKNLENDQEWVYDKLFQLILMPQYKDLHLHLVCDLQCNHTLFAKRRGGPLLSCPGCHVLMRILIFLMFHAGLSNALRAYIHSMQYDLYVAFSTERLLHLLLVLHALNHALHVLRSWCAFLHRSNRVNNGVKIHHKKEWCSSEMLDQKYTT